MTVAESDPISYYTAYLVFVIVSTWKQGHTLAMPSARVEEIRRSIR